jgi:hypothetical protein
MIYLLYRGLIRLILYISYITPIVSPPQPPPHPTVNQIIAFYFMSTGELMKGFKPWQKFWRLLFGGAWMKWELDCRQEVQLGDFSAICGRDAGGLH